MKLCILLLLNGEWQTHTVLLKGINSTNRHQQFEKLANQHPDVYNKLCQSAHFCIQTDAPAVVHTNAAASKEEKQFDERCYLTGLDSYCIDLFKQTRLGKLDKEIEAQPNWVGKTVKSKKKMILLHLGKGNMFEKLYKLGAFKFISTSIVFLQCLAADVCEAAVIF